MFLTPSWKLDRNLKVNSDDSPSSDATGDNARIQHVVIVVAVNKEDGTVDLVGASSSYNDVHYYSHEDLNNPGEFKDWFVAYGSPFSQNNYLAYLTALATYSDAIPPGEKTATASGMASVDAGANGYVNYYSDPDSYYENFDNSTDTPSPYAQNTDSTSIGVTATNDGITIGASIPLNCVICAELYRQELMD